MLFITATMAAVTREVARAGNTGGTLAFVGMADEEARGGLGVRFMSENHPDAFSWKNCLSETGGSHLPGAVGFNVGEKGAGQRRLHVHGDAGHGSTPYGKDFAIVKIGETVAVTFMRGTSEQTVNVTLGSDEALQEQQKGSGSDQGNSGSDSGNGISTNDLYRYLEELYNQRNQQNDPFGNRGGGYRQTQQDGSQS